MRTSWSRGRWVAGLIVAVSLVVSAGCGGSDSDSDSASTTTGDATTGETSTARTDVSNRATELALLLPAEDAIGELGEGNLTELGTADALVDELYAEGDPVRDTAVERLERGGYDLGVLRDQIRVGSADGPQLVRSYVVGFATPEAAQAEVSESITEVKRSSSVPSTDVPVPGIPGAEAISLEVSGGAGSSGEVFFATFSAGRFLFGLQVFGETNGAADQADALVAAQEAYEGAPSS